MLVSEGKELGRSYTPDPRTEAGGFYRSDHFPFAKQGVPAISFGAGRDLVEGGVERSKALSEVYTRDRYHQPADEWRADWDLSSVVQDLTLLYNLGNSLANARTSPDWSTDPEVHAVASTTATGRKKTYT